MKGPPTSCMKEIPTYFALFAVTLHGSSFPSEDGWPPSYEQYALNAPSYEQQHGLDPYPNEHSRKTSYGICSRTRTTFPRLG